MTRAKLSDRILHDQAPAGASVNNARPRVNDYADVDERMDRGNHVAIPRESEGLVPCQRSHDSVDRWFAHNSRVPTDRVGRQGHGLQHQTETVQAKW